MEIPKDQLERQLREYSQAGILPELTKLLDTVDIHSTDTEGFTALHYAASSNNIQCVKLLIGKGAKINYTSKNGCTPLYVASQSGYFDTVNELIGEFIYYIVDIEKPRFRTWVPTKYILYLL